MIPIEPSRRLTPRRVTLATLLLIGAVLRLTAVHLRPPGALELAPDEEVFVQLSRSLASGDGFVWSGQPTAYRDVLFPFVASWCLRLFGGSLTAVLYLQVVLSCLTALLLGRIAALFSNERSAFIATCIWLFYPAAILVSAQYLTETLFAFLWVCATWLSVKLKQTAFSLWLSVATGAVIGLAMLTRAVGIALLVSTIIYLLWPERRDSLRPVGRAVAFLTLAVIAVCVPWMARNAIAVGKFTLNTNRGVNFLIGNNPHATGAYKFESATSDLLPEGVSEVEQEQIAYARAWQYIRDNPLQTVARLPRKFAYLWATDLSYWYYYLPRGDCPSLAARLKKIPFAWLLVTAVPYAVLMMLAAMAFILVRGSPLHRFCLLQLALGTMATIVAFGLPRYHFPLMIAVAIAATLVLTRMNSNPTVFLKEQWRLATRPRRVALLTTLSALLTIWLAEILTIVLA